MADPYLSSVKLLMHCDSLLEEVSGANVTVVGAAATSTAQKVFGSGSLYLDGAGSYVTRPDSADWDFGIAPFTIEMRVRFVTVPSNAILVMQWSGGWAFWIDGGYLYFRTPSGDSAKYAWTPTGNTWYALAVDRDGSSNLRIYLDGAQVAKSTSFTNNIANSTATLTIGSLRPAGYTTHDLNGYIDEVRITKGVARYGSDSGYTLASAVFPTLMGVTATDTVGVSQTQVLPMRYTLTAPDLVGVADSTPLMQLRFAQTATETVGVSQTQALKHYMAMLARDWFGVSDRNASNTKYKQTVADLTRIAEALSAGRPVLLTQGIVTGDAARVGFGALVAERLGLTNVLAPKVTAKVAMQDGVRLSDRLLRFLGGSFLDALGLHDDTTQKYRATRALSDGVGLHDAAGASLVVRIVARDGIRLSTAQALKMVFKPTLVDNAEISAAYVSPNGTITTWAVNTRTGAVTEYGNYDFNSFAQLGHKYLGASRTGLYELDGDDDQGANIIARLKSGWAQFAGSRYSMFKAAYLGVHGSGDVYFKLEAGTGETYTYQVKLQDTQTTKVRMGKGLRARYFAFELVTTGQDFDLDTVEFVPIVAQRRV